MLQSGDKREIARALAAVETEAHSDALAVRGSTKLEAALSIILHG